MFDILKGMDSAVLHSIPYKADEVILAGEWVTIDDSGKAVKQSGTYEMSQGPVYQVFGGTDRLDSQHLGRVTTCLGNAYLGETDKFEAVNISAGNGLTVKDGVLTKATVGTDPLVGWAISSNANGRLRYTRV